MGETCNVACLLDTRVIKGKLHEFSYTPDVEKIKNTCDWLSMNTS